MPPSSGRAFVNSHFIHTVNPVSPGSSIHDATAAVSPRVADGSRATGGTARALINAVVGPQLYRSVVSVYRLGRGDELRAPYPIAEKMSAWRRGFRVEQARLYGLEETGVGNYITDYQRLHRCSKLNAQPELLDNKLMLRVALRSRGHTQADTVAFISNGVALLRPIEPDTTALSVAALEKWLLEDGGDFIVKPIAGCRGAGVFRLRASGGRLERQRGMTFSPFDLRTLSGLTLIERAVEQGAFWAERSPVTYNTMRVLTMWAPGDDAPFVGAAVQRFGTRDTAPTDNWSGGGICARIDLDTGRMGVGRMHPAKASGRDTEFRRHPDTGAEIEGATIPFWDRVREEVLRAAVGAFGNRYIGWDVLVNPDGVPVIIEGNKNSDVNLLQVHGGLLADPAVRRFYERTGVI